VNNKKSLAIGLLLVLSTIICININPVSAQRETIDSIDYYYSGTDLFLNISVTHIYPGAQGYNPLSFVDHVEIDLDGDIQTLGDVVTVNTADYQSLHFSVQYNMGEVTGTPTVYARAIGNVLTGEWFGPVVVPEFPLIHLLPILMVTSIAILLIKSKITAKVQK